MKPSTKTRSNEHVRTKPSSQFAFLAIGIYVAVTAAVPYQYGPYLAALLVAALLFRIAGGNKIGVAPLLWTFTLTCLGILGVAIGLSNNNAGALATSSVYILEPLTLGLLFVSLTDQQSWPRLTIRILDIALIATAALGIAVFLSGPLGLQIPEGIVDPAYDTVDTSGSTLRTNYQGYNSFIFLAPYGIVRFIRPLSGHARATFWSVILLTASLSGIILSGRRILYITVPLAVILVLFAIRIARTDAKRSLGSISLVKPAATLFGVAVLIALLQSIGLHPVEAISRMIDQFTLGDPDDKRVLQSQYLLEAWSENPLFGSGAGATIPGYSRNPEAPWSFELSYHVVLFNFGIFGLSILLAWGLWIIRGLMKGIRGSGVGLVASLMAGFIGTVLAIYVDPYVHKLDGMWMLFIPFAAANFCYLHAQRVNPRDSASPRARGSRSPRVARARRHLGSPNDNAAHTS